MELRVEMGEAEKHRFMVSFRLGIHFYLYMIIQQIPNE